jgi:hypothetical protein
MKTPKNMPGATQISIVISVIITGVGEIDNKEKKDD